MNGHDPVAALAAIHPRVRARFPMIDRDSGGRPRTYLNTGAGSLTVDTAAEAARDAQGRLNPMPGTVCPGEAETAVLHARVRALAADFVEHGGDLRLSEVSDQVARVLELTSFDVHFKCYGSDTEAVGSF